jgi:hypothetical protein
MHPSRSNKKIFSRNRRLRRMTGSVSHKVTGKVSEKTYQPKFKRKYNIHVTRRGWINLGILVGVIFLLVLLVMALRSPFIAKMSLQNKSVLTANPVSVEIIFGKKIDPANLVISLDGEDRTAQVSLEDKNLQVALDVPDGDHRLDVAYKGKVEKSAVFRVDTTPPILMVDEMSPQDDGTTTVRGRVEGAIALNLEGNKLACDKEGVFTFKVNRYDYPVVTLTAADAAGNQCVLALNTTPPPNIKGIHVSISYAADAKLFNDMVELVKRTELNGMQIDVKDETGYIGYDSQIELANQVGSDMPKSGMNLGKVMDKCWYNDIYTIGRVVCFQDNVLPKKRTDLAIQDNRNGGLWKDPKGYTYLDPYNKENWNYIVDIAKEAGANGYKEIQFDYMRFPSDGNVSACVFPKYDGRTKDQVVTEFIKYLRDNLKPLGIQISGDIFGLTASDQGSMGIGQDVTTLGQYMDYLCPMVYPSHYNRGEYNISVPEANPHDIVFLSLEDFKKKLAGTNCRLRPWLQDFTITIPYTPEMVEAQIQACYDAGVEEWLLWDPHCTFSEAALQPEGQ